MISKINFFMAVLLPLFPTIVEKLILSRFFFDEALFLHGHPEPPQGSSIRRWKIF